MTHDTIFEEPFLYTIPETARELRSSNRHVYYLIERGDLEAVKLGKKIRRVRTPSLRAYIAGVSA